MKKPHIIAGHEDETGFHFDDPARDYSLLAEQRATARARRILVYGILIAAALVTWLVAQLAK